MLFDRIRSNYVVIVGTFLGQQISRLMFFYIKGRFIIKFCYHLSDIRVFTFNLI